MILMDSQQSALIEEHLTNLNKMCRKHRVRSLSLFGSAVAGDFDAENSDLDFIVHCQTMTPREHADAYFGLLADLESLFARPIDLVEERAIHNPFFRRSIESSRQLIYEAA